jgi:hypothetical protein
MGSCPNDIIYTGIDNIEESRSDYLSKNKFTITWIFIE